MENIFTKLLTQIRRNRKIDIVTSSNKKASIVEFEQKGFDLKGND